MVLKIKSVEAGGIGQELGLQPGDVVQEINHRAVKDIIDYYYSVADEDIVLSVVTRAGSLVEFIINKVFDEDLGLQFQLRARPCRNKCIFCFIDQQPPGLRTSLYVKDDDYRLSFLDGNYITLTNLNREDYERIAEDRISPLYVSVHAADKRVRSQLLGRRDNFDVLATMLKLRDQGIQFHGQIVVCPGYNDGAVLAETLEGLSQLGDSLLSLAVVPVGLTRHREKLTPLRPVDKGTASEIITLIDTYQERFLKTLKRRVVFAADEFYVRAGLSVPPAEYYEDFVQLENGIGLIRRTLLQAAELDSLEPVRSAKKTVLLITGNAARNTIKSVAQPLSAVFPDLEFQVKAVDNRFLGEQITVAGLLAGEDIINAARTIAPWDVMIVPGAAVRAGCYLDDCTLSDQARNLDKPVYAADDVPDMVNIIRNEVI